MDLRLLLDEDAEALVAAHEALIGELADGPAHRDGADLEFLHQNGEARKPLPGAIDAAGDAGAQPGRDVAVEELAARGACSANGFSRHMLVSPIASPAAARCRGTRKFID